MSLHEFGSTARRRLQRCAAFSMAFAAALCMPQAQAAPLGAGTFELDNNATHESATDWVDVFNGTAQGSFLTDPVNSAADNTFTGGGSKDVRDINKAGITNTAWAHSAGAPPDKDDLEHAFAYATALSNGDQALFFGTDRYSNSGDSAVGIWFFKNPVTENADGTFNGVHSVGDILITSDFLQGGADDQINVFVWNGNAANPLTAVDNSTISPGSVDGNGVFCLSDGNACAGANKAATAAPWPYVFKGTSGNSATFPQGTFFEGGINLTRLNLSVCFSSFLVMSRSAASLTAQLKDYVLGPFTTCSIGVSKQCSVGRLTNAGDHTSKLFVVNYNGVVTNTGGGALPAGTAFTEVDDSGTPADASDDVTTTQTLANALPPGGTVSFSGSYFSNFNPPTNGVSATAAFGSTTLSATFSTACTKLALSPMVMAAKQCGSSDGKKPPIELIQQNNVLVVQTNVSGTVCNTSTSPGLNLVVDVTDDESATGGSTTVPLLTGVTLVQGAVGTPGRCAVFDRSYKPASDGTLSPGKSALFSDTVTVVAPLSKNPSLQSSGVTTAPADTATATCSICQ